MQKYMPPLNVGLTGNIGSGKSTVARLFAEHGAVVIDADALAREATQDPEVLGEIAATFGDRLVEAGKLDRTRLAEVVFNAPEARAKLNVIIHPWVARERDAKVAALTARTPPPEVIIHDVPLLFEVGLDAEMDKTVAVDALLETRVARVVARSGLTPEAVRSRDAAQLPPAEKVSRADFVIDNGGEQEDLVQQVELVWQKLVSEHNKS